jgi:hypothetical protein
MHFRYSDVTYAQIEVDLLEAIPGFQNTSFQMNKYLTKGAAQAWF